jgi:ABC-type branched-subunit amino acid transport system substrate-binding protein
MTRLIQQGFRRRQASVFVALASVGALALAACGSSGTSSASGGGGSTGGSIHMTVLGSDTGAYSGIGQAMYNGAVAGAAMVNAAGGIMGQKLVLDRVDTHGDPADAVPSLQQELAKNHPVGIIGPTTLEIFGVHPIIDRNQIPDMFNGGSTAFDNNTDPWIWRINPSDSQLALALALYARQRGYTKAAILFTTEASQQELEPFLKNDYTKLGGSLTTVVNVTPGQSSYNSEIVKLLATHPQVILGQLDSPTAATFFNGLKGLNGTKLPFIGTDLTAGADWISAVGAATAHTEVTSVEGGTPTTGAGPVFNAEYQKLFHSAPLSGANYAYDGVIDMALAIDAAKGSSNTDITRGLVLASNPPGTMVFTYAAGVAALKKGQKINYDGASGPMDYDKYHNVSGPWNVVKASPSGSLQQLETITAATVSAAEAKVR